MPNLFSSMRAAATGLEALQQAAAVAQNNVANISTPGYARQRVQMAAMAFDPQNQLAGGVEVRGLVSTRDEFAEQAVMEQNSRLSLAQEKGTQVGFLEGNFDLQDATGIAVRMDQFFTALGSWSIAPNSIAEKTSVIDAAKNVAESFNRTAQSLQLSGQNAEVRVHTTLDRIGDVAERIRQYNLEARSNPGQAAGEATVHADLEELSTFVDFQTLWQKDGTVTVLIGRETALVTGDQVFGFSVVPDPTAADAGLEGAIPAVKVIDHTGADVTATMNSGQLGALLEFRNKTIPDYSGSVTQPGDLNRLAKQFADRVNEILTAGDPNPAASTPMFTYTSLGSAAQSMSVPDEMTTAILSAADPSTDPPVANGRALQLAALAHPATSADKLDGLSYISFFGNVSAGVGRLSSEAKQSVTAHLQLQAQALSVREQISGVSLDEEAVSLVSIQRAYEATSRMISVIDEMTKIAVNIGRG